jgi:Tfp pilus assembly protein PilX
MHAHKPTRRRARRGTVYILVLGVVAMLTVFGVGGAMLARNVNQQGVLQENQVRARLLAESYLDLVHARLNSTTSWRSTTSHNAWSNPAESLAGGLVQYKLVDELDGSLSDDATDPVRLYARAEVGGAVRVFSIELTCHDGTTLSPQWPTFRQDADE